MEVIFGLVGIAVVIFAVYQILEANEDRQREKEKARAYVARMQAAQARSVAAEYERQRAPRSAPVTTGKPAPAPVTTRVSTGSTPVKAEVKRHDNSFDEVVDTYTAPTYSSSHSTSSYSSHSCSSSSSSSSSSDSSSSSSDSGSGGCD